MRFLILNLKLKFTNIQINYNAFFNMCLFVCLHFDISFVLGFNKFLNFDLKIKFFSVIQRSQFCPPEYDLAFLTIFQLSVKIAGRFCTEGTEYRYLYIIYIYIFFGLPLHSIKHAYRT